MGGNAMSGWPPMKRTDFYNQAAADAAGSKPDASGHGDSQYKHDYHPRRYIMDEGSIFDTKQGTTDIDVDEYNKWHRYWLARERIGEIDWEGDKPYWIGNNTMGTGVR